MNRAFVILLAVVALVATSCGSKPKAVTKAQYEAELQTLGHDLTQAGSAIGKHIDIAGFNQDISDFQDHLRRAAQDLHGVKPPANAQAANKRLADSFDELADDFEPVKDPDGSERNDDQPMPATPRHSIQSGRHIRFNRLAFKHCRVLSRKHNELGRFTEPSAGD